MLHKAILENCPENAVAKAEIAVYWAFGREKHTSRIVPAYVRRGGTRLQQYSWDIDWEEEIDD